MAFAPVPKESKTQINKAGSILLKQKPSVGAFHWAFNLVDRWRACHAYPINTFQATLRARLRPYTGETLAAQRLKRMPTIIDKLRRYRTMRLTTMQDIAGVRAILDRVEDIYRLADKYREKWRLAHELVREDDYVASPRSEDGYRSIHLIYKYHNRRAPEYNGLRIELQIRTRLQHIWATAVESMGTFLGQALKSRQGDQEWLDFFSVTSSAFAHMEGCPPVPRYADLSSEETYACVADAERGLGALNIMQGLSVAANAIYRRRTSSKGWSYHLIVLNSLKRTVEIVSYDRESFDEALSDYAQREAEVAAGAKIEPVLVSAGRMERVRRAYPNFFLDIDDFASIVGSIVNSPAHPRGG